jgi:hypothetical protein
MLEPEAGRTVGILENDGRVPVRGVPIAVLWELLTPLGVA